jgi:uncharacterized LabA/DUF88 family protein
VRTTVYIDGFNLYHGLARPLNCKWVNLQLAFEKWMQQHDIQSIKFFEGTLDGSKGARQSTYIHALQTLPKVQIFSGPMKIRRRLCRSISCSLSNEFRFYEDREEKHTDVRIAVEMVADAASGAADCMLLVSADTDMVPALETVKRVNPQIRLEVALPAVHFQRIRGASSMKPIVDRIRALPPNVLIDSQFPPQLAVGGTILDMPAEWRIAPSNALEQWQQANPSAALKRKPHWLS